MTWFKKLFRNPTGADDLGDKSGGAQADRRQLLIDVSNLVRLDARTGIQRVVRALLKELSALAPPDVVVRPVYAHRRQSFRYVPIESDVADIIVRPGEPPLPFGWVKPRSGDWFLGLDLAANIIPSRGRELRRWRREGISVHFFVFDVLPITHPQWFQPKTVRNFRRWFSALPKLADELICISETVKQDVHRLLASSGHKGRLPMHVVPLGSDLSGSVPSRGTSADVDALHEWMARFRVSLVVGTLEPRKGHWALLNAFEEIWLNSLAKDALLIIGRPGWKTEELQQRLLDHSENGHRLLWLPDASDEMLTKFYGRAEGIICASEGEGFGLPIFEALHHGKKVLVRDLPVFREIAGDSVTYFQKDDPIPLAATISSWLEEPSANIAASLPRWEDSGRAIWRLLLAHKSQPTQDRAGDVQCHSRPAHGLSLKGRQW